MPSIYTATVIDKSDEASTVSFNLPDITSLNADDVLGNTVDDAVGGIRLAMAPLILGNYWKHQVNQLVSDEGRTTPANGFAQREFKAIFYGVDNVNGRRLSFEVPTFDAGTFAQDNTDELDLTDVALAAFVTAVQTYAISRDGNAITITRARIVGRSS